MILGVSAARRLLELLTARRAAATIGVFATIGRCRCCRGVSATAAAVVHGYHVACMRIAAAAKEGRPHGRLELIDGRDELGLLALRLEALDVDDVLQDLVVLARVVVPELTAVAALVADAELNERVDVRRVAVHAAGDLLDTGRCRGGRCARRGVGRLGQLELEAERVVLFVTGHFRLVVIG